MSIPMINGTNLKGTSQVYLPLPVPGLECQIRRWPTNVNSRTSSLDIADRVEPDRQ
jgi:hypothetical protein